MYFYFRSLIEAFYLCNNKEMNLRQCEIIKHGTIQFVYITSCWEKELYRIWVLFYFNIDSLT
jgi:hypothetical protein